MIGPLIDIKAVEKIEAHIAHALKRAAKVVNGGKRADRQHEGKAAMSASS
jgi:acyl-CoA reductase-like NAD-dependent aldehyde dehydrogenase